MCQFFSAIVFRTGQIRFCEDDSHEVIIRRLGLRDDADLFTRGWVRVECVPPHESVRVDETSTPGWYDEDRAAIDARVMDLALRITPATRVYNKAIATATRAYDEAIAPARRAYDEAIAPARRAYNEAVAPAERAHDEAVATAERAYISALASIEGYVPQPEPAIRKE